MAAKRSLPSLTALKGLFIFVIVLHNTFLFKPLFDNVPGTAFIRLYGGALGNSMFFILSGYLLSYSYRERIRDGSVPFKTFLLRRLKKLYPLYIITNAAALMLAIAQHGISVMTLKRTAFTILLQMGGLEQGLPYNSPTWFVGALFACYVLFFFVAYYAKRPTQYHCAIVFGIAWGYMLIGMEMAIPFCYSANGIAYLCFFIGCGLAELYPLITRQMHKWLRPASFLVLASSFYLLFRYGVDIISGDFLIASAFVLCPLIVYLALAEGWCSKLLGQKPFVLLGRISVSVYFWHLVVYTMLALLLPGGILGEKEYVLYLLVLIVWSILSYKFIEKRKKNAASVPQ